MRGYALVGLDNPKNNINVGSAMRAVGVYDAAGLIASGQRFKRAVTDTMKHYRHIPFMRVRDVFDINPYDCVPVAVDLVEDAISLPEYTHPERAYYIFGAEDATLGTRILSRCRDRVFIPMSGCMNLAASVNVVLYDRLAKQLKNHESCRPKENDD